MQRCCKASNLAAWICMAHKPEPISMSSFWPMALTKVSSFSIFAIMVLDVNFINPYETAGFLFFNDKEDAKKTANSVVKLKGCLIDVHVDINNLSPFPRDHQIQIKL